MVGGILYPDYVRMEPRPPRPGYAALRRYRRSRPGSDYFLTINLATRGRGLEIPALTNAVINRWEQLDAQGYWRVRTGTVMPDHLHLLIRLGDIAPLDECLKRFKGRLQSALRWHGLKWQEGYYDHEVRAGDDPLPIFLYIYLNPYRAELVPDTQTWPGYRCRPEDWDWFGALTKESAPQPEWLR